MKIRSISSVLALILLSGLPAAQAFAGIEEILGKWVARAETPNGPLEVEFDLTREGETLVGTAAMFEGAIPLSAVKFENSNLSLELSISGMDFKLTGVLKDGKFTGMWEQVGGDVRGPWTATRKSPPAATLTEMLGSWNTVAVTPGGDLPMVLDLKQEGDKLTGSLGSDMGSVPVLNATFNDNTLQFEVDIMGALYRVKAAYKDDKLAGDWAPSAGGAGGPWNATRKVAAAAAPAAVSVGAIAGLWDSVAVTPNGDLAATLELIPEKEKLTGIISSPMGSLPIQSASFKDNTLQFEIDIGGELYRVKAGLAEGSFKGSWAPAAGGEGGVWSAKRKVAAPAAPAAPAAAVRPSTIEGTWESMVETPGGNIFFQLVLRQSGSTVLGDIVSPEGSLSIDKGSFSNNTFSFQVSYMGGTYRIEATLTGSKLVGKWASLDGPDTGNFSAEKKP